VEHPYLYFVTLFELIGLGHFAHHYPHVVYTWVVMAMLIIFGFLATKGIQMIPNKGQNVFEILISALENFMVDITGEEGRWLFPLLATVFIFIFLSNLVGLAPGFFPPTGSLNTTAACALTVVVFTHVIGFMYHGANILSISWDRSGGWFPLFCLLNLSDILPEFYPFLFVFSETSWARSWFLPSCSD
jgi:F-type H+-transporting ATPase subunit a